MAAAGCFSLLGKMTFACGGSLGEGGSGMLGRLTFDGPGGGGLGGGIKFIWWLGRLTFNCGGGIPGGTVLTVL